MNLAIDTQYSNYVTILSNLRVRILLNLKSYLLPNYQLINIKLYIYNIYIFINKLYLIIIRIINKKIYTLEVTHKWEKNKRKADKINSI